MIKRRLLKERSATTAYIRLNTRSCKACWKCIDVCAKNVIDKIDVFFHRHAIIRRPEECIGCLKCTGVCETGAIVPYQDMDRDNRGES